MIVCQRCGRENDGRYRFCLGCGAPVPRAAPAGNARPPLPPSPDAAPTAPPPSAPPPTAPPPSGPPPAGPPPVDGQAKPNTQTGDDAPLPRRQRPLSGHAPIRGVVRSAPGVEESGAVTVDSAPPAQSPVPIAPLPRRTGTPAVGISGPDTGLPGSRPSFSARAPARPEPAEIRPSPAVSTPPAPPRAPPAPPTAQPAPPTAQPATVKKPAPGGASAPCVNCGFAIPPGYSFCGACGTPVTQAPAEANPEGPAGYLALIDELGNESERFPLRQGDNRIGRGQDCDVHFSDALLADHHCTLVAGQEVFRLRPLDFYNGTYVRISTPVELQHGDVLRVGQEVLRFERIEEVTPETSVNTGQPLRVGCPAPRGVWGRLCQIGLTRQVANAYLLSHRDVFLGRERGDILFPKDGFVSGSHAVISERGGRVYLKDLGSSNGTFLRIKREKALRNGDLLLLGRNLLCVHVEV